MAEPNGHWQRVIRRADVPPGTMRGVEIGTLWLAIYNVGGDFHATSNLCSHAFGQLSEGSLEGTVVTCPLHGAAFDVRTGAAVAKPADFPLDTFPVRIVGDDIEVLIR